MKKMICILITVLFLSSCTCNITESEKSSSFNVVCTVFPAYDWIREITKNTSVNLYLIPSNGTDIHSYQPSVEDIVKIKQCDLFVCSKGHEKVWYDEIEIKEKFNLSVFENHDEHVWMSLKNAADLTAKLTEKFIDINPENKDEYIKNSREYEKKLLNLNEQYTTLTAESKKKVILVADRFPYVHLTEEYNIDYYAAFSGCSAESEVSFETVAELSDTVNKQNLNSIITTEDSDNKIARAVISNSDNKNIEILTLDSMQSVTEKEVKEGLNYINVMKKNLLVLKEALN